MMNNTLTIVIVIAIVAGAGLLIFNMMNGSSQTAENESEVANMKTANNTMMEVNNADPSQPVSSNNNIVETAVAAGNFTTLVTAVQEAGLVETLSGEGPFTVFAPTDEAFDKLPDGTLEAVLADKEQLTDILTYHVVPGKVMAEDVVKLTTAPTAQGQELQVEVTDDGVMINDAKVITTDIETSNGVIHVIDTVLLPQQ